MKWHSLSCLKFFDRNSGPLKAVDPIPVQTSNDEKLKNNSNESNKLNKQTVIKSKSQNTDDQKQQHQQRSENIPKTNTSNADLPNSKDVFGSLVSLNDFDSNTNRDQ